MIKPKAQVIAAVVMLVLVVIGGVLGHVIGKAPELFFLFIALVIAGKYLWDTDA